jgi:hypothetical protein
MSNPHTVSSGLLHADEWLTSAKESCQRTAANTCPTESTYREGHDNQQCSLSLTTSGAWRGVRACVTVDVLQHTKQTPAAPASQWGRGLRRLPA